jgi:hypothetical protein
MQTQVISKLDNLQLHGYNPFEEQAYHLQLAWADLQEAEPGQCWQAPDPLDAPLGASGEYLEVVYRNDAGICCLHGRWQSSAQTGDFEEQQQLIWFPF